MMIGRRLFSSSPVMDSIIPSLTDAAKYFIAAGGAALATHWYEDKITKQELKKSMDDKFTEQNNNWRQLFEATNKFHEQTIKELKSGYLINNQNAITALQVPLLGIEGTKVKVAAFNDLLAKYPDNKIIDEKNDKKNDNKNDVDKK